MLILARKKNQRIIIDDSIEVIVIEIRGDKVRLGIEAPREVPVHRQEIYDLIQQAKAHAETAEHAEPERRAAS